MEDIKTNSLPDVDCGVAYLAHPYTSTSHSPGQYTSPQLNREDAGKITWRLMRRYTNLTIISPLHAYSFLDSKNLTETEILYYDFKLLSKCTHLILSGNWRNSKGCMAEYGYAVAKGIRIYEYRDGLLYPLE
jgi:hypothetical protein